MARPCRLSVAERASRGLDLPPVLHRAVGREIACAVVAGVAQLAAVEAIPRLVRIAIGRTPVDLVAADDLTGAVMDEVDRAIPRVRARTDVHIDADRHEVAEPIVREIGTADLARMRSVGDAVDPRLHRPVEPVVTVRRQRALGGAPGNVAGTADLIDRPQQIFAAERVSVIVGAGISLAVAFRRRRSFVGELADIVIYRGAAENRRATNSVAIGLAELTPHTVVGEIGI